MILDLTLGGLWGDSRGTLGGLWEDSGRSLRGLWTFGMTVR